MQPGCASPAHYALLVHVPIANNLALSSFQIRPCLDRHHSLLLGDSPPLIMFKVVLLVFWVTFQIHYLVIQLSYSHWPLIIWIRRLQSHMIAQRLIHKVDTCLIELFLGRRSNRRLKFYFLRRLGVLPKFKLEFFYFSFFGATIFRLFFINFPQFRQLRHRFLHHFFSMFFKFGCPPNLIHLFFHFI